MILHCNFEELSALKQGAHVLLEEDGGACAVVAPPGDQARVAALVPLLVGDIVVNTLEEQRTTMFAVETIVECLRAEMDAAVVATHPADELAVSAYFDFAHALAVLSRARDIGREMEAMIEVVTGNPPTAEVARTFVFPD